VKVFLASKNLGKIAELQTILRGAPLELDTYPLYADPIEGETSYAENAEIKARALLRQLRDAGIHAAVLADDSGIEVTALGGRPGVLSSRYGGSDAQWPARRTKLLKELSGVPRASRSAKFCCAVMLLLEDGTELTGYGEVTGIVTEEERGTSGFGYDPIFWYPPALKTFAELSEDEKNRVRHRRRAVVDLLKKLVPPRQ